MKKVSVKWGSWKRGDGSLKYSGYFCFPFFNLLLKSKERFGNNFPASSFKLPI